MKRRAAWWLLRFAAVGGAVVLIALLVVTTGLVPIKASSGHWAITAWFLEFTKDRSVATHSLAVTLPPREAAWLVMKGAGHYEGGCRPCHGSPGLPLPRVAGAMTPHPPALAQLVSQRDSEQLFYVIKHGIKFTGMPAWPTQQRDDEVTAVVAFLEELPHLDAERYRQLVFGPAPAPSSAPSLVATQCERCHGDDGRGRGSAAFPGLAHQRRQYLVNALEAYARGDRVSGIMGPIAAGLRPDQWGELADHYSQLPSEGRLANLSEAPPPDPARIERGRQIAAEGLPQLGVPSCSDCHGPAPHQRNPAYPLLAGQYADYLVLQLELFKERRRGGSPYAHLMDKVASRLTAEQMRDVAAYYASLQAMDGQTTER
ncbi:MAG: c-type cytochrome [Archangium sp.]|nr:c-type cytochrome [Archangium sp.]